MDTFFAEPLTDQHVLQIVLFVVGALYFLVTILSLCRVIVSMARGCSRKQRDGHNKHHNKHNNSDEDEESSDRPGTKNNRSQSGVYKSSKAIPITVTVPSLSNSSVISQSFLDSWIPDLLSSRSRTPQKQTTSPTRSNTKLPDPSKSLKLADYRASDNPGRTSMA